jgi:hypothetical protein
MACNEDSDPNDQPSSPSNVSFSLAQLITLSHQGSLGDGGPTHYEVHLSLFHIKCHIEYIGHLSNDHRLKLDNES